MHGKIALVFLILLSISFEVKSQCNCNCDVERDSLALVSLYNSTNGPFWLISWSLSTSMDNWSGVTLNNEGCVSELLLDNRELNGQIPPEIGNLECLTKLRLPQNELTGEIPVEISNLSCLTILTLSLNELTGEIPPEIGNLLNLESLGLNINNLTGNIPAEIGNLVHLYSLALQSNFLEGCIPEELLIFCGIDWFDFDGNGGLALFGEVDLFCAGENQIGSGCFTNGQVGMIDENCNCTNAVNTNNITESENIVVFPNPINQELNIESNRHSIEEIILFDTAGKIILQQKNGQTTCKINLDGLTPGVYFIKVFSDNGGKTFKVVRD